MHRLRAISCLALVAVLAGCNRRIYDSLPKSITVVPPWYSRFAPYSNSYGFKNLGTAYSPSALFLSDNVADGGDVIAVALNGQVVLDNFRIHTPDNEPPHLLTLTLNPGKNRVDILCRSDPDGAGCTLQAEISNTTAGNGLTTINSDSIPQGLFGSFIVEYKPFN
jgi:hypothetical protein